ncbi:MAG: hypothetical protein IPN29_01995 [Saprospiraceae bacterium]|nr:hypothetical protein [Saprospiraceae bacterium]
MSNHTSKIYDALVAEYPGQVYVGQIDQTADLQSTSGVILIETVSEDNSQNKDLAKRDTIVLDVHVIGLLQLTVDSLAASIRNLIEPYTDEYIYLVTYDGARTDFSEDGEVYRKVITFTIWNNYDGLNTPTGYWEYYAIFDWLTGDVTVLNQNELNYMQITWSPYPVANFENNSTTYYFPTLHTYAIDDIEVFYFMINNEGTNLMHVTNAGTNSTLELQWTLTGDVLSETRILIRVRKSAVGQFISGV